MISNFSQGFFTLPHPLAPTLSGPDAPQILSSLLSECKAGNYPATEKFLSILAEAGLVSMWFFGKVICGYSGPFNLLDDNLHRDMCNFRQSPYCMTPGSWFACFAPRKVYKTTIFTELASAWEIVRNPDITIRFTNAVVDRARDFLHTVQRVFDDNELFAACYPRYVIPKDTPRNNEREMTMVLSKYGGMATRYHTVPTIKCGGVEGAAAGDHHDIHHIDDAVDMTMLNQMQQAGAEMESARKFIRTSTRALVVSWTESRVSLTATRYGIDDCYSQIWEKPKAIIGHQDSRFKTDPKGRWTIYYRTARENNEIIMPSAFTEEGLAQMAEEDWWTYSTQYMNNPYDSKNVELMNLPHKTFRAEVEPKTNRWKLVISPEDFVYLDNCDCVIGCDSAATEKDIKARTSRTAVTLWARDSKERLFNVDGQAGYVDIFKFYDWVFDMVGRYLGCVRLVAFEKVAFQKVLKPLLEAERQKRKLFVLIDGFGQGGDKIARIRARFGSELQADHIFIEEKINPLFLEEKNIFPQSRNRVDYLDASELAIRQLYTPLGEEEEEELANRDREWESGKGRNRTTGYRWSIPQQTADLVPHEPSGLLHRDITHSWRKKRASRISLCPA